MLWLFCLNFKCFFQLRARKALYHYTTESSAKEIRRSKFIQESTPENFDDSKFGEGCYFTIKSPQHHTKEEVAKNNWGKGWKQAIKQGKLEFVIKVYDLEPITCEHSEGRDIWLYRDNVNLEYFEHEIQENTFKPNRYAFLQWAAFCYVYL